MKKLLFLAVLFGSCSTQKTISKPKSEEIRFSTDDGFENNLIDFLKTKTKKSTTLDSQQLSFYPFQLYLKVQN